jgi:hypothetical protein
MELHPTIQFMDYTAIPKRFFKKLPPNYHLTFSRKETASNHNDCKDVLNAGGNVAVVFHTKRSGKLPNRYMGKLVIDGDISDIRFQDPKNVIVGLRAKGKARANSKEFDNSGFVVRLDKLNRPIYERGKIG